MPNIPTPIRAAVGLAATALDEARKLPETLPHLPVTAVGTAMQASLRLQQHIAALAARGDQVIGQLRGSSDGAPDWATFDDDTSTVGRTAAFDRVSTFDADETDAADETDQAAEIDGTDEFGQTDDGSGDEAGSVFEFEDLESALADVDVDVTALAGADLDSADDAEVADVLNADEQNVDEQNVNDQNVEEQDIDPDSPAEAARLVQSESSDDLTETAPSTIAGHETDPGTGVATTSPSGQSPDEQSPDDQSGDEQATPRTSAVKAVPAKATARKTPAKRASRRSEPLEQAAAKALPSDRPNPSTMAAEIVHAHEVDQSDNADDAGHAGQAGNTTDTSS